MERQRKLRFDEALKRIYFPPQSPPPPPDAEEDHAASRDALDFDGGDEEKGETFSETESSGMRKLTRAQRKRIRKKKLKEAVMEGAATAATSSSQRRRIIGPERPPSMISKDEVTQSEF